MSSSYLNDEVLIAKNALVTALGDQVQKYFKNMKMWLRNEWTKEQFDAKSRKLLTLDKIHLHNKFFLTMLNKMSELSMCIQLRQRRNDIFNDYIKRHNYKGIKTTSYFSSAFAEVDPCGFNEDLEEENLESARSSNPTDDNPQSILCIQGLFLEDIGSTMGRFLIGAWQEGLMNVDDNVVELVCFAKQILLKNIISAIIMKRKSVRLTGEGTYYYDVGASTKDIRNTVTTQISYDIPVEIAKKNTSSNLSNKTNDSSTFLASSEELYPQRKHLITIRDLYNTLQDRNIIPSHHVYHVNMERIIQMLH